MHRSRSFSRRAGWIALAGASLFAAPSRAQSSREPEAAAHFHQGVAFAHALRWNDAIREFEAAADLAPTEAVRYDLGLAYRAVGRDRDAIRVLRAYLDEAQGHASIERTIPAVEAMIAELTGLLAHVSLQVVPATANLTVDGQPVDPTRLGEPLALDPGSHVVVAQADGFHSRTETFAVNAGGSLRVPLELARVRVARFTVATLDVAALPEDASIRLDGRVVGHGRFRGEIAPGDHRVEVASTGREPLRRTLALRAGEIFALRPVLAARSTVWSSPWLWTAVGVVVVAGLTVGGVALFAPAPPAFRGPYSNVSDAIHVTHP